MPTVPMVRQDNLGGAQIPSVMSADAAPIARGGRALGRGIADLGRAAAGIADIAARVQERKTQEEVDSMLADYDEREIYTWNGAPGEGGEPTRGVKDWGEGDGSAVEAMKQLYLDWRDNPEGLYKKASPEAQRRADRALRARTARMFSQAAQKDTHTAEARRQNAAAAALATSERSAMMYAYDDGLFTAAAIDATDAAARLKLARLIVNPGEPDPGKLRFKSGDGKALYDAARAEHFDKLRFSRARTLAEGAGTAESEPAAAARMAMATAEAETLPPAMRSVALNDIDTARAQRLDGMLGAARAEPDLDKRERLVATAEQAAKDYGAGGKLRGAVAEDARRLRKGAQDEENRLAIAALAEGRAYDPGDNPRRQAALAWAAPKIEKARQAEQRKTLASNGEYIGAMTAAGVWFNEKGQLTPVSLEDRRSLLRGHLAGGHIRIPDYLANKAKLDEIEAGGLKERHERVSAEVCAALGEDIKTLWTGRGVTLGDKEDPSRKVGEYTFADVKRKLAPEMETVTVYTGGAGFGGAGDKRQRPTGRLVERETVIRYKRELLAADVAKAIDLLTRADYADGLMVDLDGNPATPAERLDARTYTAKLIGDIKSRQWGADLDTQAAAIYDAISARARDRGMLDAAAITKAKGLRLPGADTRDDTEDEDDD